MGYTYIENRLIFIAVMQPLLLLHGAIGASRQLVPLVGLLRDSRKIYAPDFTGHGGRPIDGHFSMKILAEDVLQFMEKEGIEKADVFGYSMGGYVGMYLAKHYPEKVRRIITLATKYHWDEATAAKEVKMLDPEKIQQKIPSFADTLKERHAPNDWREVLKKTADMMLALGCDNTLKAEDYTSINIPALLLIGDRDKMITLEETIAVYKALPYAQMGILPDTQHPIEQTDIELLGMMIKRFLR